MSGPSAPAAIEVIDLVKRYDGTVAVEGVAFRLARGSLCALLGPNGAGKTTLSECIGGFRVPDAGSVRVLGRDPRRERARVAAVLGVMLQEGGAYPAATPREMVTLHTRFHRVSRTPDELLRLVGLAEQADTRYRRLSGGQKQRLSLALALVGQPQVLVLDEPTAAMDPVGRTAAWELLRRLRDDGVSVLFTTHDLREAERLADRVIVMDRGHVVADDAPSRLAAAGQVHQLLVTTPAVIDASALSARVGAAVSADGDGRWVVAAGSDAIPTVTAWFSDHGLPLTGITAGGADLESVFTRLVGPAASSGAAVPHRRAQTTARPSGGGRR